MTVYSYQGRRFRADLCGLFETDDLPGWLTTRRDEGWRDVTVWSGDTGSIVAQIHELPATRVRGSWFRRRGHAVRLWWQDASGRMHVVTDQ